LPHTFYDYQHGDVDTPVQFSIFGIPWDANSTHTKGCARAAPDKLRKLSLTLGRLTEEGHNIDKFNAADFGNVPIYPSLPEKCRDNIAQFVKDFLPWEKSQPIPIMIGGDHYCTYPVVKALTEHYRSKSNPKIGILIMDAHLDYYDKWLDVESDSHCTVTKRIADLPNISPDNITVMGVRDIDTNEMELAKLENLSFVPSYKLYPYSQLKSEIDSVIKDFQKKGIEKLYISLDIDVLDGCVAPGTGYTIPGGLSYRDLWILLQEIVLNFDIIGFDVVEVAPDLDIPSNLTQITAIKLITEIMSFISAKTE
jgi:agmatinase